MVTAMSTDGVAESLGGPTFIHTYVCVCVHVCVYACVCVRACRVSGTVATCPVSQIIRCVSGRNSSHSEREDTSVQFIVKWTTCSTYSSLSVIRLIGKKPCYRNLHHK